MHGKKITPETITLKFSVISDRTNMDDEYGQMFGGEEYIEDDNFDDEIIDYDDGDTAGDLDLGSEEEVDSP